MAIIIPTQIDKTSFHRSSGERLVLGALEKGLPNDYIVFHSVAWQGIDESNNRGYSGEADFLIFHPRRGFLSIEVKSGGIQHTSDGLWYEIDRNSGERHLLKRSPMAQAWESANYFNSLIFKSDIPAAKIYKVKPIVWFSGIDDFSKNGSLTNEFTRGNTFSRQDLGDPTAALLRAYEFYGLDELDVDYDSKGLYSIISIFSPDFKIVPALYRNIAEQNCLVFNRLTNEQSQLLDFLNRQRFAAISGVGGTGKTMLALERARRIPTEESVLFLCFNKFLLDFLRQTYAESMPNVSFYNLNEMFAEKTHHSEFAEKSEITAFLNDYYKHGYDFDHIIIDEGQDFAAEHLEKLYQIAKTASGYFYIFYDENQLVHQWDNATLRWFQDSDLPKLSLTKNCRNTYHIAATAYRPVNIEDVELVEDVPGEIPVLKIADNDDEAMELIAETIRDYTELGFTKKQIAILTVKTIAKSILRDKTSVKGYRLSVDDPNGSNILFTTARKFKGLEKDVIILIDIDEECFKDDNAKAVFYVGTSRARSGLTLIANLNNDGMARLVRDLGIEHSGAPRRLLEEALNIKIVR